jgi:hypothetical protein
MRAGQFEKGNPGKPKGAKNKSTRLVKEVFSEVFSEFQADPEAALSVWGKANLTEFYKLAARLIPTEVEGESTLKIIVTSKKDADS